MDAGMTESAVLILGVGEGMGGWRELNTVTLAAKVAAAIVAFETNGEDLRPAQQASVHAAMGEVTGAAAIDTHGGMFKDKGTTLVNVAFEAGFFILETVGEHARTGGHAPGGSGGTVGIVAV